MNTTINIQYIPSVDEAIIAALYHRRLHFRWPYRFALSILISVVIFGTLCEMIGYDWLFFSYPIFAIGFYWLFFNKVDLVWSTRRRFRKRPDKDKVVSWEISENEIRVSSDGLGEALEQWGVFRKVIHTPKGFLLYSKNKGYLWLPHSGFLNPGEIAQLSELAKEKVKKYIKIGK